jgi:hypothetical protein
MAAELPSHREKMREMFAFWGWNVAEQDVRLAWHEEAALELAIWTVFRKEGNAMVREWVISEPTGVLPIDHLPAAQLPNAPSALRAFATHWEKIAMESLEDKVGPERAAYLRENKPDVFVQNENMRQMIGIAAELLDDFANDAE